MAKKSPSNPIFTPFPSGEAVRFDPLAFDDLVAFQGIQLVHWRAMRCPVGMIDPLDTRRPHPHHENCSNGYLYMCAGKATSIFSSNSDNAIQMDLGIANSAQAQLTLPRFYDDCSAPVKALPYDRFFLADEAITVPHWQTFESSPTGEERLSYPVVCVEALVDADGTRYTTADFSILNGQIKWSGPRRPAFDASKGKGKVCSIRYTYRPFWYVKSVNHEIRCVKADDPISGETVTIPTSQQVTVQREYLFENEARDPDEPKSGQDPRQGRGPRDGSFPPR